MHCIHPIDLPPHVKNCNLYTLYTFQAREGVLKALGSTAEGLRFDVRKP